MTSKWNEPNDIIAEQRDRLAIATFRHKGHYPLLLYVECYIYFDEWVQIVEANVFNTIKDCEVVVESRSGTRAQTSFNDLYWKFGSRMEDHRREQGFVDIWTQYDFEATHD